MPTAITLHEVRHVETKHGFCSACGGRTNRQRTWTRYITPAARNRDGSIKSASQHREDILTAARAWQPNHDHTNCPAIRAERIARKLARK